MKMWTNTNLLALLAETLKDGKVILESSLEVSNEIKKDLIYGLGIYPIKNVTEVYKGYMPNIGILSLLQVLLTWFFC